MTSASNEDYEVEDEEDIDISWEEFEETSNEAYNLFGLSGTPGNAIVNKKTGTFKAVGGAYPQETIEAAVAAVRDGSAQSDDIGNAWTLTQEQISELLDGVYYKDDNSKAEIVIIEYSDLLCPYCKRHYNNRTLENIVEADDSVALVFKNMPIKSLHPTAPIGAKWVECAWKIGGTKAYYEFLDAAFAEEKFSSSNVLAIANKLWLDESEFTECFNN
jgi:protein-disulfide isomerase